VRFQWINEHTGQFDVAMMCRELDVSRSGYYAWRDRPLSARAVRRQALLEQIREEHAQSRQTSGAPKVKEALVQSGITVCLNTVAKYMRESEIRSVRSKRFKPQTTDSRHDHAIAPNTLDQNFVADAPDQKWLCDITYIPTDEGFVYLASVLDCCSRKIIGWQMADHLRAELCLDALVAAIHDRRPGVNLLHHSDRGVQYACDEYRQTLRDHKIACSMSRTGNCYDNAMMESFHASLKLESVYRLPGGRFKTKEQARRQVFEYIEVFYNRQRRHSAIGYMSPVQFEASRN
jgi:transposase InsO family protein